VLSENCGASVIVVISKCDLHKELSDAQLNKVQYHVRNFCINRGAALVYTSMNSESRNVPLLYKYVAHRVYGTPFTGAGYVIDKESVFVPSGWDTNEKLDVLKEMLPDLEPIREVNVTPIPATAVMKETNHYEDEQTFLQRIYALASDTAANTASPKRDQQTPQRQNLSAQFDQQTAEGNSPLLSFFSNLMKKDDGRTPPQASSSNQPPVDPQAHFQKIITQIEKKGDDHSS